MGTQLSSNLVATAPRSAFLAGVAWAREHAVQCPACAEQYRFGDGVELYVSERIGELEGENKRLSEVVETAHIPLKAANENAAFLAQECDRIKRVNHCLRDEIEMFKDKWKRKLDE